MGVLELRGLRARGHGADDHQERYDLSNKEWSAANFAGWYATSYTDEAQKPPPPTPFQAKNIVIVGDPLPSSLPWHLFRAMPIYLTVTCRII